MIATWQNRSCCLEANPHQRRSSAAQYQAKRTHAYRTTRSSVRIMSTPTPSIVVDSLFSIVPCFSHIISAWPPLILSLSPGPWNCKLPCRSGRLSRDGYPMSPADYNLLDKLGHGATAIVRRFHNCSIHLCAPLYNVCCPGLHHQCAANAVNIWVISDTFVKCDMMKFCSSKMAQVLQWYWYYQNIWNDWRCIWRIALSGMKW